MTGTFMFSVLLLSISKQPLAHLLSAPHTLCYFPTSPNLATCSEKAGYKRGWRDAVKAPCQPHHPQCLQATKTDSLKSAGSRRKRGSQPTIGHLPARVMLHLIHFQGHAGVSPALPPVSQWGPSAPGQAWLRKGEKANYSLSTTPAERGSRGRGNLSWRLIKRAGRGVVMLAGGGRRRQVKRWVRHRVWLGHLQDEKKEEDPSRWEGVLFFCGRRLMRLVTWHGVMCQWQQSLFHQIRKCTSACIVSKLICLPLTQLSKTCMRPFFACNSCLLAGWAVLFTEFDTWQCQWIVWFICLSVCLCLLSVPPSTHTHPHTPLIVTVIFLVCNLTFVYICIGSELWSNVSTLVLQASLQCYENCFHCCFAGLTAVRSDEVYDLMMKDYPEKYHVRASHTHTHTHTHTHMHARTHLCTHARTHACTAHMHACTHARTQTHTHTCFLCLSFCLSHCLILKSVGQVLYDLFNRLKNVTLIICAVYCTDMCCEQLLQ